MLNQSMFISVFCLHCNEGGDTGVPISHLPQFLTPNLPPPTIFYPQSPTSHNFLPPISHLPQFVTPNLPHFTNKTILVVKKY